MSKKVVFLFQDVKKQNMDEGKPPISSFHSHEDENLYHSCLLLSVQQV